MTPNDDWTEMSRAWTEPRHDDGKLSELAGQVRRRSRLARLNFWFEMAGCVIATGIGVWLLAGGPADQWLMAVAAVIFGLFAGAMTVWARGQNDQEVLDTPEQALRAAIRQAEAGRRWAQAGVAVSIGAAMFMGVGATAARIEGVVAVIYGAGVLFILAGLALYLRHEERCAHRIARHRQALDDLTG